MKEFCKKYDMKESTAKALIKDGWLTLSLPQYEEVVIHYRSSASMQKTADHFNISKSEVAYIINRFR